MRLDEFDYHLPPDRIAQHPLPERDASRLLILDRQTRSREEAVFRDLPCFLTAGDLLVVNRTRVVPRRLKGKKKSGARAEITLVNCLSPGEWECLVRVRNPRPGVVLELEGGVEAELREESPEWIRLGDREGAPLWRVRMKGDVEAALAACGLPALPPYVKRRAGEGAELDRARYQTVYAERGEAAAAPTAGLHFTPELIARIQEQGIALASIVLEVNYGTFAPVRTERVEEHRMYSERYELPVETAAAVEETRRRGCRVIAVGTTAVRTLEHCAEGVGRVRPGRGETGLFIYPGYRFQIVDALLTNFHLPRSTLLLLVCAFAGRDFILESYEYALRRGFRFLSYGDAMLIL